MRRIAGFAAALALFSAQAAEAQRQQMDANNPTCPAAPNVSTYREMRFTVQQRPGQSPVLLAEGMIDDAMLPRLEQALATFQGDEIWLRSPGGNAQVGNAAGRLIRTNNMTTRIPQGWTCFSACNFVFMGGIVRYVDQGGIFMVHMFTHTGNREVIRQETARGEDSTISLIGEIEQQSAILASQDNDFLIRMGISRTLLTEIMYRQSAVGDRDNRSTRRCLTQAEVNRFNVATVPWTGR